MSAIWRRLWFLFILTAPACYAQIAAITGFCTQGAIPASTSGLHSTNSLQGIVPQCTVTVFLTGTSTIATVFADGTGTPLGNPFTATTKGQWVFFSAINQGYDVVLSGGGNNPSCVTLPNCYASPVTITGLYPAQQIITGAPANIANQANGVVPLATAPTAIAAQSHLDDGVTSANTITSSRNFAVPLGTIIAQTGFGSLYAKQFQTGLGNNGIANAQANNQMVVADPSYAFTEFPGPNSFTASPVFYQDLRNGQQTNVYRNPQVAAGSNFNWGLYPFNGAVATPGVARTLGVSNWCMYDAALASSAYCQAVGQQSNMPGYSIGFPSGLTGTGWYNDEAFSVNMLSRMAGISGGISCITIKDGIGDNVCAYFYHHSRGGRTAQADESHVNLGLNSFEDADYVSTCVSGCTAGSQSIKAALGNAGNQGVGQYLIDTTQGPTSTGNVTAIAAGLYGGQAFTVDATVPVSNAWGTIATVNTPVSGVPPFTTTETVTITVTSGTFVSGTLVCFSGDYHEQAMPTSVSGSPPNQTLTFSTGSASGLRRPHISGSGIMQGGTCGNGLEVPYYTTTGGTRYVFDVLGSTDAHTLQVGQFLTSAYGVTPISAVITQLSNFTNATTSLGTSVSFVYTGAGSTIFHPWNYVGAGITWNFTGSSDSALNAACTNPIWSDQSHGRCDIVGLTGTHTTTTPLVGTLGLNAFKLWPIAETLDVQDYSEITCQLTTLPDGSHPHAPCVDGTFALEPNVIQFATSDAVEQLNHPSMNMKAISAGLTTRNPFQLFTPLSIVVNGYGNQGGSTTVSSNSMISISSQGVANQFTTAGGILSPANAFTLQGPYNIGLNMQAPTAEQPFINLQSTGAQLANPNYFYSLFTDSNVAGSGISFRPKSNELTLSGNVVTGTLGQTTLADNLVLTRPVAPTPTFTQSAINGTLAAGTYCYRIAVRNNAGGPGIPGTEACSTFGSGTTNLLTVKWTRVAGDVFTYVYGRTTGAELLMPTGTALPVNTLSFVDDGTTTPSGAMPVTDLTTPKITGAQSVSFLSAGTAFNMTTVAPANVAASYTEGYPETGTAGSMVDKVAGATTTSDCANFTNTTGRIGDAGAPCATAALAGTTASIGGGALLINACASGTATVSGATTSMHVFGITPTTDPNAAGMQTYDWYGRVTSSNTVTIYVCALVAGTPGSSTYTMLVQ